MHDQSEMNHMSEEEIEHFENWVKNCSRDMGSPLSNSQLPQSRVNYQAILKETKPCYIFCGSNAGGRSHMIYYKSRDQRIYGLSFYIQTFEGCWSVGSDWEQHIGYETV